MLDYEPDGAVEHLGNRLGLVRLRVRGDLQALQGVHRDSRSRDRRVAGEIHASEDQAMIHERRDL